MTGAIAAAQLDRENAAQVAQMLEELKRLSPDEVKAMLEMESRLILSEDKQ